MNKTVLLFLLISLLLPGTILAGKKKIKFGKISKEELEMDTYAPDTSAVAVVLYSGGFYSGNQMSFFNHRRVKILKKEGYDYANFVFSTGPLKNIRAYTYNLVDGEIVETKLAKENIKRERIFEDYYQYKIAMPEVKVGSVIDIEVTSTFPYPEWYFMEDIPVVKSDLLIERYGPLEFIALAHGFILPEEVENFHWVMENVPAFVEEPFMNSDKNYRSRVEVELRNINWPRNYTAYYAATWEDIYIQLRDSERFGGVLIWKTSADLRRAVKQIEATAENETEKAQMAVETIKSLITWDGSYSFFSSKNRVDEMIHNKTGNSADINLALTLLLRMLDFEVYPMVLSTRDNGMLPPNRPTLSKLNYVVAYAKINGEFMPLDATSKYLSWDMLPERCLNYFGRVMDKEGTREGSLIPKHKMLERVFYDLVLDEDFRFAGKASFMKKDYAAYNFRLNFSDYLNEQEYVDKKAAERPGLEVSSFSIDNIDDVEKPVVEKYEFELEPDNFLMDVSGELLLNMFLFEQIAENPFKLEERFYPVDFSYERISSGTVRITLPDNVSVTELPKNSKLTLPDNAAQFTMQYFVQGNVITLKYKLAINRIVFSEKVYPALRNFYAQVVEKEAEPVILKINETD